MNPRPKELSFRPFQEEDALFLKKWLSAPDILLYFPMDGEKEIEDSVRIWTEYGKKGMGITALWDGAPVGAVVMYVQGYKKLAHTCLFSIIVAEERRGFGVGGALIEELMVLAKNTFQIEILHLEVYDGNPAKRLYERLGFTPFGAHDCFTKENGKCRRKIFMQKYL